MAPHLQIVQSAAELVKNDRAITHGDAAKTHGKIATLWNAYRSIRRDPASDLTNVDVAVMMALLKIARTQSGEYNPDDYVDGVGYLSIAGELAS